MSDVTPEFAAGDLTAEEAKRLAWKDDDFPARVAAHVVDHYAREEARRVTSSSATGWDLVADVLDVTAYDAPVKSLFARQPDNKPLAYVGGLHILFGLPKSGKSYVAAIWAAQEIAAGRRVAWFDFDNQRASIASRFRALGLTDDQIRRGLAYVEPTGAPDVDKLAAQVTGMLCVFDTLGKLQAHVVPGSSSIDYDAVTQVEQTILRPLTRGGATVLVIDHEAKSNGGTPFGSVAKLGAADLVWHTESRDGYSTLTVSADRHDEYDDTSPVARLVFVHGRPVLTEQITSFEDFLADQAKASAVDAKRDKLVTDAVADAPEDFWSANSLAKHLGTDKLTGWSASSWRRHIGEMIRAKKLGAWKVGNGYRLRLPGTVSSLSAADLAAMGAGPAEDDD